MSKHVTPQLSLFKPGRARGPRVGRQLDVAEYFMALIASAVVGDVVTMLGDDDSSPVIRGRLARARRWIAPRCASTSTVMLGCQSCRQPLANLTQLLWHLEAAPNQTHTLARLCGEHGWEAL